MISFADKTFLITGAASGIARATATELAKYGANIALSDINLDLLKSVKDELSDGSGEISCHETDVSNPASCRHTVEEAAKHFGKIDHLIHAAGIYPQMLVKDMTDTNWKDLMRVNLDGTFYMCRAVIPYLSDNSSIVNLASVAAHRGSYSHAHYAASKGAVVSFSKSLALELAPKTRVNTVSPGIIATAMTTDLLKQKGQALLDSTPLKRFGTAQEVAGVILFLCSRWADFVTGETIHVNGGLYMV